MPILKNNLQLKGEMSAAVWYNEKQIRFGKGFLP